MRLILVWNSVLLAFILNKLQINLNYFSTNKFLKMQNEACSYSVLSAEISSSSDDGCTIIVFIFAAY